MGSGVTQLLNKVQEGCPSLSSENLLAVVYDELRRLAAARMAWERPGNTLQPTALVHEAWLRLVRHEEPSKCWANRAEFFAAAAVAMRRILIEWARRKAAQKRGCSPQRVDMEELSAVEFDYKPDEVLIVHEALEELEKMDHEAAVIVNLKYFADLTFKEIAQNTGMNISTVFRTWERARRFLYNQIKKESPY